MINPTSSSKTPSQILHDMSDEEFFQMLSDTKDYYTLIGENTREQKKFCVCETCPYKCYGRTRDLPELAEGCDILIVGNKPVHNDVPFQRLNWKNKEEFTADGDPVVGDAFEAKKWHGIKTYISKQYRSDVFVNIKYALTNAVLCYNKDKGRSDDVKEVISNCGLLLREKIRRTRAKVVVLLGRQAVKAIVDEEFSKVSSIDMVRGRVYKSVVDGRDIFYIPTHSMDDAHLDPSFWSTILLDLEKAKKIVQKGFKKPPFSELFKNYVYPSKYEDIKNVLEPLTNANKLVAFDIEASTLNPLLPNAEVLAISVAWGKGQAAAIPTRKLSAKSWEVIKTFLESSTPKVAHNATYDVGYLREVAGIKVANLSMDTMLSHYIIDENRSGDDEKTVKGEYTLKKLVWDFIPEYGGYEEEGNVVDLLKSGKASEIKNKDMLPYAACDADVTLQIAKKQIPPLLDQPISMEPEEFTAFKENNKATIAKNKKKHTLWWLATKLMPRATYAITNMERGGMRIDLDYLKKITTEVGDLVVELKKEVEGSQKGKTLNLNKPSDVSWLLFDKLKFKPIKETKSGYSTDKKAFMALEKQIKERDDLSPEAIDLVEQIQAYKKLNKLYSSVLSALPKMIDTDGRVHPNYKLVGTVTGRLSCSKPNLQQIQSAIRFNLGGNLRTINIKRLFVPDEGHVLMGADYSQIEMCILAAFSNDEKFIYSIKEGLDLHCFVASNVWKIPYEEMLNKAKGSYTKDQLESFSKEGKTPPELTVDKKYELLRSKAKAVGFGIVYGTTNYGLSRNIGVTEKEAQNLIDSFFKEFPGVKKYIDESHREAARHGYAVTKYGRRRRFPIIQVRSWGLDNASKRQAQNSKIQGTASDICLESVCDLSENLPSINGRIVTTVHDSIYSSVPNDEESILAAKQMYLSLMRDKRMTDHANWLRGVPIKIDVEVGDSWGEQMGVDSYLEKKRE